MRAMPRPKRAPEGTASTRDRVLAVAIGLMQERGYNGFSFQDVAKQVGISHVAVHHHFASKATLAVAAMSAYTVNFRALLDEIDAREPTPRRRCTPTSSCSPPRCTTTSGSACAAC